MPLTGWPVEEPRQVSPQTHCGFFRMPPELRNRIYEDLLFVPTKTKCIAIVHERETSGAPSVLRLLLTCKQICDEAEGIFYNLNELYFDVDPIDLPNFHRFLRALTPQRRKKIMRINLDLGTVESLAFVLRLLTHLPSIKHVTFGFPRGHNCLKEGLLMRKLKKDADVIKEAIQPMAALQQVKVVVGSRSRQQFRLVAAEARTMQMCLQSLVERKSGFAASSQTEALQTVCAVPATKDVVVDGNALYCGELNRPPLKTEWPARSYSNFYNRFETPEQFY